MTFVLLVIFAVTSPFLCSWKVLLWDSSGMLEKQVRFVRNTCTNHEIGYISVTQVTCTRIGQFWSQG